MAIIIEEEGSLNYHKVRCNKCDSMLKYFPLDEKQTYHMEGYFGPESIWSIICPVCGTEVITHAICGESIADFRIK